MRNLREYISESVLNADDFNLLFENNAENLSLQEVFERIGDAMISAKSVNEGKFSQFLKSIGNKLISYGDKTEKKGEEIDNKIKELSSDVKTAVNNAIENTKKKAGETWDKIKDAYKSVVLSVGSGVDKAKQAITDIAKLTGQKVENIISTVSTICSNGIAKGKESISSALETPAKMAAISLLIAGAQSCQKNGVEILDVLIAAGIKA